MEKTHYFRSCVFLFAFLVGSTLSIAGAVYDFDSITSNSESSAAIGESQFFVDVINTGPKKVTFKFSNIGVLDSSMSAVYFDAGDKKTSSVKSISSLKDRSDDVKFKKGAKTKKLEGGEVLGDMFSSKKKLSASINPKRASDGIGAGEYLNITLKLNKKRTYDDVLADLESGKLRIGVLAHGFVDGLSESYVNGGLYDPAAFSANSLSVASASTSVTATVPVPGSILLAGAGMCLVRFLRFRK
jgi:hypothetical protein